MSNFSRLYLILIILVATAFRLHGINWDQGYHLHPDERMIVMVAERISFPNSLNPQFFAYGSLPIYLLSLVGDLSSIIDPDFGNYEKINLVGRFLSTVFDIGTLIIIYKLSKYLFNKGVGLVSAAFYALAVLPIQLSHFYAVDTLLTFFITITLYLFIKYFNEKNIRYLHLACLTTGFALATKTSALILFVPLFLTIFINVKGQKLFRSLILLITSGLLTVVVFLISEPFALLDFSTFLKQTLEQQAMTKDAFTFPYTFQYVGKTPYLYELLNIFNWGLGPVLAILAFIGIVHLTLSLLNKFRSEIIILLSFFWIYFLVVGSFAIGFVRYMLPLYPLLCLSAGYLIYKVLSGLQSYVSNKVLLLLIFTLLLLISIWPLSFSQIYSKANTRVIATNWINTNIPQSAILAREHWDDELPVDNFGRYQSLELPMYEPDTPAKWEKVQMILDQADYLIIASNRLYVPLTKLSDCQNLPQYRCYKESREYYQKLFNHQIGYIKVAEFSAYPKIPFTNLVINDSDADESFTVYDHPKVMIFKNDRSIKQ